MARVTIEDCTEVVPNRFHLVQVAAIRTKQLKKGAIALVSSEENKDIVVALREVAAGFVKPDYGAEVLESELEAGPKAASEAVVEAAPEATPVEAETSED